MNPKLILPLIIGLLLVSFASAALHTITVRGEPRTPDNKIDLMYDAGAYGGQGKVTAEVNIDNEKGVFEVKDYAFDDTISVNEISLANSANIGVQGTCFYHSFNIKWQNNQFEVFDAYASQDSPPLKVTKESTINLGVLKEDRSNQIMVDSDAPVSFQAFDMNGKEVASTGGYKKFTGMSDSFYSNSRYKIIIRNEAGDEWEKEVTTGVYCESTRIIKRGNLMLVEHFPNNSFPEIGFFREVGLFFKRLFS